MLQIFTHYFLHFIAIGAIAFWYDRTTWKRTYLILLSTMLVDLDHIFANPLFDPNRCGIGHHPLHSAIPILIYLSGAVFIKNEILRLVCIGLLFHMFTDLMDCLWIFSTCGPCYTDSELYKWAEFFGQ